MKDIITKTLIAFSALLILFAIGESIGRLGDLHLAKERPDLFPSDSFHIHYANNSAIMHIHVIAGMLFLLTGVHQLIPYFRKRNIKIHRSIGKIFLGLSFVVSLSAIIIALFIPYGNLIESISNLIFGIYILYSTFKAYSSIKAKDIIAHSNWVKRVFFVSLSIASIRIIMISFMLITQETVQQAMGKSFLIGFLLHATIIELWISSNIKRMESL